MVEYRTERLADAVGDGNTCPYHGMIEKDCVKCQLYAEGIEDALREIEKNHYWRPNESISNRKINATCRICKSA